MTYVPPKAKRHYIRALSKTLDGPIIAHACSQCHQEFSVKTKGVWFESAYVRDRWVWVCEECCWQRGVTVT